VFVISIDHSVCLLELEGHFFFKKIQAHTKIQIKHIGGAVTLDWIMKIADPHFDLELSP
jgi:hypothetical protein